MRLVAFFRKKTVLADGFEKRREKKGIRKSMTTESLGVCSASLGEGRAARSQGRVLVASGRVACARPWAVTGRLLTRGISFLFDIGNSFF